MIRLVIAIVFAFSAVFTSTHAANYEARKVVTAQTKTEFAEQAATVRKGMESGGRYEFVEPGERAKVEKRLHEIEVLFESYIEGKRLHDEQLVALLNAQEEINAILTKRDGDRLICTNEKPTGSLRPINNCKRYADIERAHRATRKLMWDYMATPCSSNCGGR